MQDDDPIVVIVGRAITPSQFEPGWNEIAARRVLGALEAAGYVIVPKTAVDAALRREGAPV